MTETKSKADDSTRIIVLVYGLMENGGPFWAYVAVKPTQYQGFLTSHKEGKLNLHQFAPFGEIIVSGEGKSPPDEVTLKVAAMYQTDPATLFQPIDVNEEISKQSEKARKKDDKVT